jgi:FAD/FMN-containing dehydrogenase
LLLGLKFVSGTGRLIQAGGRVVKNVAGYDVTRLLCGSGGELGLLTELTFRTLPLPVDCQALEAEGEWACCADAAAALLGSTLEPVFITASQQGGGQGEAWRLRVGFEGFPQAVESQLEQSQRLLGRAGLDSRRRAYRPGEDLFAGEFSLLYAAAFLARADVPLGRLRDLAPRTRDLAPEPKWLADFGCGRLHLAAEDLAADGWRKLGELAAEMSGHAVLERWPSSCARWRASPSESPAQQRLRRRLEERLDPHQVFSARGPTEH